MALLLGVVEELEADIFGILRLHGWVQNQFSQNPVPTILPYKDCLFQARRHYFEKVLETRLVGAGVWPNLFS